MTITQQPKPVVGKSKAKLAHLLAPACLETLARQSAFIQRTRSKMTGQEVVALMTTDMLDDPAVS